jgi:hypothetical protein
MTVEDKQTVLSILVAATLSFVVVGVALLSALALTDRPRPSLEETLSIRPDPTPMAPKPANRTPAPEMY